MNAELLLMFTLGCDRAYLHAHPERELTFAEGERYVRALGERSRGIPAQYITGHQEFWGMDFLVTPAVLIPRPETEHVVETVLELTSMGGTLAPVSSVRIVDVGTGSGSIALARTLPQITITTVAAPGLGATGQFHYGSNFLIQETQTKLTGRHAFRYGFAQGLSLFRFRYRCF